MVRGWRKDVDAPCRDGITQSKFRYLLSHSERWTAVTGLQSCGASPRRFRLGKPVSARFRDLERRPEVEACPHPRGRTPARWLRLSCSRTDGRWPGSHHVHMGSEEDQTCGD